MRCKVYRAKKEKEKVKMKKLMIVAVVALAGIAANAAVVKWNASNVRIPVAANLSIDETGITTDSNSAKFVAGALTLSIIYTDKDGNTQVLASSPTTGDGLVKTLTAADGDLGQIKPITDLAGTSDILWTLTATYEDPTHKGTYVYTAELQKDIADALSGDGDVTLGFNMNTAGSWNYTANAIPEPTSGLLLLLGVAGLALRRRRA